MDSTPRSVATLPTDQARAPAHSNRLDTVNGSTHGDCSRSWRLHDPANDPATDGYPLVMTFTVGELENDHRKFLDFPIENADFP